MEVQLTKQLDILLTDEQQKFFVSSGRNVNHMVFLLGTSMFKVSGIKVLKHRCVIEGKNFRLKATFSHG